VAKRFAKVAKSWEIVIFFFGGKIGEGKEGTEIEKQK